MYKRKKLKIKQNKKDIINTKRQKNNSNTHKILDEYLIKKPNIFPPQIKNIIRCFV
jgi:hypothetical protein